MAIVIQQIHVKSCKNWTCNSFCLRKSMFRIVKSWGSVTRFSWSSGSALWWLYTGLPSLSTWWVMQCCCHFISYASSYWHKYQEMSFLFSCWKWTLWMCPQQRFWCDIFLTLCNSLGRLNCVTSQQYLSHENLYADLSMGNSFPN